MRKGERRRRGGEKGGESGVFLAFFEKKVLWGLFSSACPFHFSVEIPMLLLLRLVKERKTAWAPSTCVTKTKKNLVPKRAFFSPCDFFPFFPPVISFSLHENKTRGKIMKIEQTMARFSHALSVI